jgi:hypothetical protein
MSVKSPDLRKIRADVQLRLSTAPSEMLRLGTMLMEYFSQIEQRTIAHIMPNGFSNKVMAFVHELDTEGLTDREVPYVVANDPCR